MKKVSLVTLLVAATMSTAFAVNAETKSETFGADRPCKKNEACLASKDECSMAHKQHQRHHAHQNGKAHMQGMNERHGFMHSDRIGFVSAKEITKVADADKWQDDQLIVLEGNIIKQVGKKDFVFKDSTGELTLEIRHKAWRHGLISPEDKVRIVADVEKSWGKTEVEAFSVEKVDAKQMPRTALDNGKNAASSTATTQPKN